MTIPRFIDYPPVWLAFFMAVAWFMAKVWSPMGDWMVVPGSVLIAAGLALAVWAAVEFRRACTTIVPRGTPSALIESGPYRFSRNPIYVADLLILAGWALALGSFAALVLLIPFQQVLLHRFVLPEETLLRSEIGGPFEAYKARINRWV